MTKKKQAYKFKISLNELLMVMVIVAVMVVVAGIGYVSFISKASNSNALAECKQAQEVILSDLISAKGEKDIAVECDGVVFEYDLSTGRVVFSGTPKSNDSGQTLTKEMKEKFSDVKKLDGSFNVVGPTITYTTSDGKGKAIWKSGYLPMSIKEYNED